MLYLPLACGALPGAAFPRRSFLAPQSRQRRAPLDPWRVSKPLHDELEGFRRARRGEYRVVLRIDEEQRVVRVDHRSDIYRPA